MATLSIVICAAPWWLKLPAIIGVVVSATVATQRLRHPRCKRISHDRSGWQLQLSDETQTHADLLEHVRLGNVLVLRFQMADVKWRCLLASDSIDADSRRRLLLTLASLRPTSTPGTADPR